MSLPTTNSPDTTLDSLGSAAARATAGRSTPAAETLAATALR